MIPVDVGDLREGCRLSRVGIFTISLQFCSNITYSLANHSHFFISNYIDKIFQSIKYQLILILKGLFFSVLWLLLKWPLQHYYGIWHSSWHSWFASHRLRSLIFSFMTSVHLPRLNFYIQQNTRPEPVRVNQVGTISCKNQTEAQSSAFLGFEQSVDQEPPPQTLSHHCYISHSKYKTTKDACFLNFVCFFDSR